MLQVKKVSKKYVTGNLVQTALNKVSLNLRDNEFVAILGPSGSGKTTLLNIIGGLDHYDSGDLVINGISTKRYKDRNWDSYRNHTIGFVFQSYNLIPHQTLLANVELALTISGVSSQERKKKAIEALDKVGLKNQYHKKPSQLSGGQMQRVAIARALVNNPDILLADEPTGALDTDTSIQVMNLLKEVAKDRLVVMVTHNPELASKYATRIVNLKDGNIISDTNPYNISKNKTEAKHETMGKTSMSLLTSLSLSFNNLKTKKARTLLTAFAGSIGIIGIALILSLSNGVNTYIKTVEEDTLAEYPLQIQSSGFNLTSGLIDVSSSSKEDENDIHVMDMLTTTFSKIGSNDLKSLKNYLDKDKNNIKKYTNSIEYSYNVKPQIFMVKENKVRQVHPDKSFQVLGIGSSSTSNSIMSKAMSTDVFAPLPSVTGLFTDQYDVKAGKWPTKSDECVLVLSKNGNISDFLLYTLGLRDGKELDSMIEQFSKEEQVVAPTIKKGYNYDDILGITFKVIKATDYYQYDQEYKVWKDKTNDEAYMKKIILNGQDLKIVGIVRPRKEATSTMLKSGIYYPASLTDKIINETSETEIVKQQLNNKEINVFNGKKFENTKQDDNSFDMSKLFSVDANQVSKAFKIDQSKIDLDLSNLNNTITNEKLPSLDIKTILSQIKFELTPLEIQKLIQDLLNGYSNYATKHPEMDLTITTEKLIEYLKSPEVSKYVTEEIEKMIAENGEINLKPEQIEMIFQNVINNYIKENELPDYSKLGEYFKEYLNSQEANEIISNNMMEIINNSNLQEQISVILKDYTSKMSSSMNKAIQKELFSLMNKFSSSMKDAISFDEKTFAKAITVNMTEDDLTEILFSIMNKELTTYDNNLKKLEYAELDNPYMISIYPKNFESKKEVINILDSYNQNMKKENKEEKVISYTDLVGSLMTSVTNIINVISYVLVAFVAISLIVSSIMIGVITYISVLERKKEIGILRAIGASKRNISQVFNAETFIIGFLSGTLGIGITLLLLIPTNYLIRSLSGYDLIRASLPIGATIILIILSVVLTLLGGLIPSKKASKEDPVIALRSE